MVSEEIRRGSPQSWLVYAYSDLELARTAKSPKVLYESLCFHAHQAVEKALKAVLIAQEIPVVKTHNIGALLSLLPEGLRPTPDVQEAVGLTEYAVSSRYPGDFEPVSEKEYLKTLRLAESVVKWAENVIRQPSLKLDKKTP